MHKRSVWGKSYKNLPIKSDYRVHDLALEILKASSTPTSRQRILDIATGTGAFAQRLSDNFPEWDIEINDFESQAQVTDFKRHSVDLNSNFSRSFDPKQYDIVLAVEIIEHLENPWHFLRELRKLLRVGGLLVLSTPNVDSTLDRLIYLLEGHPFYFGERGYTNSGGHITQVPDWLMNKIATTSGFSKVELSGRVDTTPHIGIPTALKLALLMPLSPLFMRNRNNRSINVYVFS